MSERKAMSYEEYREFQINTPSHHEYTFTKLPPTLVKISNEHARVSAHIIQWLASIGCETTHDFYLRDGIESMIKRLSEMTAFEVKIRHDNDYIECGPTTSDPKGEMFHVITTFCVSPKLLMEDFAYVTQQLELFSDSKLEINKKFPQVNMEFYDYERTIAPDYHGLQYVTYQNLEFRISHTWGSSLNDGRNKKEDK